MTEMRPLTARECFDLLATQDVGRVAFSEHAMPTIRPVNFVLDNGDIVIRTGTSGSISRLTSEVVAFEVDHFDRHSHTGWSVVVLGKVHPVTDVDDLVRLADPQHRPWPAGDRSHFLRIPVDIISGRVLPLSDTGPLADIVAR